MQHLCAACAGRCARVPRVSTRCMRMLCINWACCCAQPSQWATRGPLQTPFGVTARKWSPCVASATQQCSSASHKISPTCAGQSKLPRNAGRLLTAGWAPATGVQVERCAVPPRAGALHLCEADHVAGKATRFIGREAACKMAPPGRQRRRVRSVPGRLGPDQCLVTTQGCQGDLLTPTWAGKEGP